MWEEAERAAALEYVSTKKAARLTGWSPQTLRAKASLREAREDPGDGWEGLEARTTGSEWAFVVSTIPIKGTRKA